jgi:hypothetical protein
MTGQQLRETIRQHRANCEAKMAGRTALVNEAIRQELLQGPLVDLGLEVENVSRQQIRHVEHSPPISGPVIFLYGKLGNADDRSWLGKQLGDPLFPSTVIAIFDTPEQDTILESLQPGQRVAVRGYATGGYLSGSRVEPFFLTTAQIR